MGAIQTITAAASRVLTKKAGKSTGGGASAWQTLAYDLNDDVPEVGAYVRWISSAMGQATLYAGRRLPDGGIQRAPTGSRAAELVAAVAGGPDGQAVLLQSFGTHLSIAGETYLVIVPDGESDDFTDDRWYALSREEATVQRGKIKVIVEGSELEIAVPETDDDISTDPGEPVAIRVWRPSARRAWEATSPIRSSITVLEELRLLNAAVAAIARSRITGRGVLLVPAGARFPVGTAQDQAEDSLLDTFVEVASTAIREPESAAATVPIVLEVPGDIIGGVKWLSFESGFDDLLLRLRDEAVRRFAAGVDIPGEVLLGMGDVNHWGAWAMTAEAIRMGVEPALALVTNALTEQWLQPLLEAENDPDAGEWMVLADTSNLRTSSNKAASALEAFKLGLIRSEAARRELGFDEADAPDGTEETDRGPGTEPTTDREGTEDLPVEETQAPPQSDDGLSASMTFTARMDALTAAVDGLAWAALTAAGQKLRQTPAVPRPERTSARSMTAAATHTRYTVPSDELIDVWRLLDGAWNRVPEIAARYGVDADRLAASLNSYTRALLVSGQPHTYGNSARLVLQMGL